MNGPLPPQAALPQLDEDAQVPKRKVPFLEHAGITPQRARDGVSLVSCQLSEELLNNHGAGHGGLLMTLLDSAMAHAALSRFDYAREVVTVDMHVSFIRPTHGLLQATGRVTGGGRSIAFCEGYVVDDSGEVAAKALGTFKYRDKPKAADKG